MGEASYRIEQHIEAQREELDKNLREIESRIRMRRDYLRRRAAIIGLALCGGMLLAVLVGRLARS